MNRRGPFIQLPITMTLNKTVATVPLAVCLPIFSYGSLLFNYTVFNLLFHSKHFVFTPLTRPAPHISRYYVIYVNIGRVEEESVSIERRESLKKEGREDV